MAFRLRLIECVRKHPILYTSKDNTGAAIFEKNKIWQSIAKELNSNIGECKLKWRNIRDNYKKYQNKKLKGDLNCYNSKYESECLSFLNESLKEDNPLNIKEEEHVEEEEEWLSDNSENNGEDVKDILDFDDATSSDHFVIIPDMSHAELEDNVCDKRRKRKSKPRKPKIQKNSQDTQETQLVDNVQNSSTPTHDFFKCMADIVSKFPPEVIADVRIKLCRMVTDTEVSLLKQDKGAV